MLKKFVIAGLTTVALSGAVAAQTPSTTGVATPLQAQVMSAVPQNTTTVTNWYKQDVYDSSDQKIGAINDVLLNNDGKVEAFIVSIGGFLGLGEKDVAVPFSAVHATQKNGKWMLTMNANKDSLKDAPGFRFDRDKGTWVPASA
jgi:sporulation protein YlmC with PRC-barrel domain